MNKEIIKAIEDSEWLKEHDAKIKAEAEREFQNSDYWNDYLAKVIADAKAEVIDEFVEYVKQYMWWSTESDEKVIGEFALGEYATVFKDKLKEQNNE